ncbi:MAG: hypothetical protein WD273_04795 [Trueperaceae bacterium]
MRLKGILITLVVVVGLLFAVLNWQVLFTRMPVNLLLGTVQLPLGISLLVLAVALSLIFFLAALWERAGQLRQVTHQERLIDGLRERLDRKQSVELGALEGAFRDRIDALSQQIEVDSGRVEVNLQQSLSEMESRLIERMDLVQERVVLVRNELAADIGELEDRLQSEASGEAVGEDTRSA